MNTLKTKWKSFVDWFNHQDWFENLMAGAFIGCFVSLLILLVYVIVDYNKTWDMQCYNNDTLEYNVLKGVKGVSVKESVLTVNHEGKRIKFYNEKCTLFEVK